MRLMLPEQCEHACSWYREPRREFGVREWDDNNYYYSLWGQLSCDEWLK